MQHSRLIDQGITLLCKHNGVKLQIDIPDGVSSVETIIEMFSELQNCIKQSIHDMEDNNKERSETSKQAFSKVGVRVRAQNFVVILAIIIGNNRLYLKFCPTASSP